MSAPKTLRQKSESPVIRILLLYHCKANTGYAIETLEKVFWEMALRVTGSSESVFLAYPSYEDGKPRYLPPDFSNLLIFDFKERDPERLGEFQRYLRENRINLIFGFDQPPNLPYYRAARYAGVTNIVSYWGAPMSSLSKGMKLLLKKLQVRLYRHGPDRYIFESKAMAESAFKGRGIPRDRTAVCYLGVDTNKFKPNMADRYYAHDQLEISYNQKLIFYSGHFEARKGVAVIARAANIVAEKRDDVTFVLFGNKPGEEELYAKLLTAAAKQHVIFGGYRNDLNRIHRSCHAGVIASTGWDSFTVSALEIQSSGLPILTSDLEGLREALIDGQTGGLFPPGDHLTLAEMLLGLLDNACQHRRMGKSARQFAVDNYSTTIQTNWLTQFLLNLTERGGNTRCTARNN